MDGMRFVVSVHLHGTLAANAQGAFSLPCGATLVEVSAVGSNANDATLQVGTSADADGVMTAAAIGDSSVPVVKNAAGFNGALCDQVSGPHFADGTIMAWLLDFDGAAGTAAQNVGLLFTFLEG